ncbi:MAG: SxtJ family membrane protein [Alphaproteobacteria bacterium]|nr:SxtJ family membrane protein [Alphaproteobacteria bacterium]
MQSPQPDASSLRSFGFIWAVVFAVISLWPLMSGGEPRIWALIVCAAFVALAVIFPAIFHHSRFYQGWIKFGEFLGLINSRIIMFIMFAFIFVPVSMIFKLIKRDPLHRKPDPQAESYFIMRETQPNAMHHQF